MKGLRKRRNMNMNISASRENKPAKMLKINAASARLKSVASNLMATSDSTNERTAVCVACEVIAKQPRSSGARKPPAWCWRTVGKFRPARLNREGDCDDFASARVRLIVFML